METVLRSTLSRGFGIESASNSDRRTPLERLPVTQEVAGSSPSLPSITYKRSYCPRPAWLPNGSRSDFLLRIRHRLRGHGVIKVTVAVGYWSK